MEAVMRRISLFLTIWGALVVSASCFSQSGKPRTTLDIYVVDVEGGNATLFVAPSGESVLIDTGNAGPAAVRDAGRILEAAKDAGLTEIDHLIITHWHADHFGGAAELAAHIPIKQFIDHGTNVQPTPQTDEFLEKTYPALYSKAVHTIAKPGDKIAMNNSRTNLDWRIVAAAGQVLKTPLPGAGKANPYCSETKPMDNDPTENAQSVSSYITFGKFRVVHMGDLTWNKEMDLMCPANRLGTADLLIVSHHGQPISNSPALVHALAPRVAIMNNGTRKGGQPEAMKVIYSSPGLEDLWQLHFSLLSGEEYSAPGVFIANTYDDQPASVPVAPMTAPAPGPSVPPPPAHEGKAYWIKVSAEPNGTFTVTNARNGFRKTYKPGPNS
jgi:beta-lactamase superfamily II metal-dependent hydrolase